LIVASSPNLVKEVNLVLSLFLYSPINSLQIEMPDQGFFHISLHHPVKNLKAMTLGEFLLDQRG